MIKENLKLIDIAELIPMSEYYFLMTDEFEACDRIILNLIKYISNLDMKKNDICILSMNRGVLFPYRNIFRFFEFSKSFILR